jgi:hypothetical protein
MKNQLDQFRDVDEKWEECGWGDGSLLISSLGRVFGKEREYVCGNKMAMRRKSNAGIRSQRIGTHGYLQFGMSINGKYITKMTHILVAAAFVENPDKKPFVNHKNGVKIDNRASNLEWVTSRENQLHAITTGLKIQKKGSETGNAKLTEKDAVDIYNSEDSHRILAKRYGVNRGTISKIKVGVTWRHATSKINIIKNMKNQDELEKFIKNFPSTHCMAYDDCLVYKTRRGLGKSVAEHANRIIEELNLALTAIPTSLSINDSFVVQSNEIGYV